MIARALLLFPWIVTAGVGLWAGCRLIDDVGDYIEARRRLRRLGGGPSVVRPSFPRPPRRVQSPPRRGVIPPRSPVSR